MSLRASTLENEPSSSHTSGGGTRWITPGVGLLFVISGFSGLAYEVVWFRRLAHVWGSSALATTSVLASYLLGLGLGAFALGQRADRVRRPLAWYAWSEVLIGIAALLVPHAIDGLRHVVPSLQHLTGGWPVGGALARVVVTFFVLCVPCVLLGGTFPFVVRWVSDRHGGLRHSAGFLYALNTLGGALGAYAAGFHLLPWLGVGGTEIVAACGSLAAGMGALVLERLARPSPRTIEASPSGASASGGAAGPLLDPVGSPRWIQLAAGLSGLGSLLLQVAWARQLGLVLGGSTYAFSALLAVVLLGIGLGGWIFHGLLRHQRGLLRLQGLVVLGLLVSACLGQCLIEPLTVAVSALRGLRHEPAWNAAISVLVAFVLQGGPSIAMGILLPLYAVAGSRALSSAGRTVGVLYAWNTAGTLVGSVGGALVLLPWLGVSGVAAVGLGVYLLGALVLYPSGGPGAKPILLAIALVGALSVLGVARGPDFRVLNYGMYHYGGDPAGIRRRVAPLYLREGLTANVYVTRHEEGTISLRVNGKVDASDGLDMTTQLGTAYFPRFLAPEAREVLVIGFGSGTTSGASLLFPDTNVTCAEIERGVLEASHFFDRVSHEPRRSSRFREVLDDGRSFLLGASGKYDLVISEPSNPWMVGVASLFTKEFYEIVSGRLSPGGVFAQWVQTYSLTPEDYVLQLRTVASVFPHVALLLLPGSDTMLLGSHRPLEPDQADLARAQVLVDSLPAVREDLERYFGTREVRSLFLERWALGGDGLRTLLGRFTERGIHTDMNLRLEFDAPLRLFDDRLTVRAVRQEVLRSANAAELRKRWAAWGCTSAQVPSLRTLLELFAENGVWEPAGELLDFCLEVSPEEPYFLAARLMSSPPGGAGEWESAFTRLASLSREDAARVGIWLHANKDYEGALKVWRELLASSPQAATLWINLSAGLNALGRSAEAKEATRKARELDPFSAFVRSGAGAVERPPQDQGFPR